MPTLETELWFDRPKGGVPVLPKGVMPVGPERELSLVATYWDSPGGDLLAHGVTLRHRTASDGSEDGWTLKVPAPKADVGVARSEVSVAGHAEAPPAELAAIVRAVVDADALAPIAELTTVRRIQPVGLEADRAVAEVSEDEVRTGDGPTFGEIEVEVTGLGGAEVLVRVDRAWSEAGLAPSTSKLARALGASGPSDRRGLDPKTTVEVFVIDLIESGLRQLVVHALRFRVDPTDVEAVHQARVATRRLRSNLATFRPVLDRSVTDPMRVDLRWLGRLLGEVRDAQVLAGRLEAMTLAHELDHDGLADLQRIVRGQLELAVANLASALGGDRYLGLVQRLRSATRRPPIRSDVRGDAKARRAVREVVRGRWKRLRQAIDRLDADPSSVELHQARKQVKRVRYALQAVKPLGVAAPGLVKALGRVQDDLGELHDAVELRVWLDRRRPQLDAPATFLAGQLDQVAAFEGERRVAEWTSSWKTARAIRVD